MSGHILMNIERAVASLPYLLIVAQIPAAVLLISLQSDGESGRRGGASACYIYAKAKMCFIS